MNAFWTYLVHSRTRTIGTQVHLRQCPGKSVLSVRGLKTEMGVGSSKVQVHIRADKPYYYTGDVVTGSVVFHTEQAIAFHKINLKVTGVEKVAWEEREGYGKGSHTNHYKGKHHIFKHKMPLMSDGTLQPGDYQWPISFQLPQNIPGSFNYQSGTTRASIEYKIKADCDQVGMLKPDFKKTIRIEVLQRHKAAPAPLQVAAEEPISYWCCFNKGVVGLTVTGETDGYMPGEQMRLRAAVNNRSTEVVPCVEFRVFQKVHLLAKSSWGFDHHKNVTVERVYQKQTLSGGPVGPPALAGTVSNYEAVLALDRQLEATCHSQLIQSHYELEVRAKTGCCLSEVSVKHPFMVNDPPPAQVPPSIVPPQGWSPQVYSAIELAIPAPQGYTYNMPPASAPPMQPQQMPYNTKDVGYGTFEGRLAAGDAVPVVSVSQDGYPSGVVGPGAAPLADAGWGEQPERHMPGAVNSVVN